jgi:hypothetical protein
VRKGSARKGNYRTKYSQEDMEAAIREVWAHRLSLIEGV